MQRQDELFVIVNLKSLEATYDRFLVRARATFDALTKENPDTPFAFVYAKPFKPE